MDASFTMLHASQKCQRTNCPIEQITKCWIVFIIIIMNYDDDYETLNKTLNQIISDVVKYCVRCFASSFGSSTLFRIIIGECVCVPIQS